jgi:hypothetical protein
MHAVMCVSREALYQHRYLRICETPELKKGERAPKKKYNNCREEATGKVTIQSTMMYKKEGKEKK